MTQIVFSNHLNALGSLFGGEAMHLVDAVTLMTALRHAGMDVVTASIDRARLSNHVILATF